MVRIQWIVPYTETWEVCRQQAETVRRKDMEIELIQVFTQDDERLKHCSADIVIARGITARTIQRYNPDVQIVDIQVGFAEVIHAILKCRDEMGVKKAAIILAKPKNWEGPAGSIWNSMELLLWKRSAGQWTRRFPMERRPFWAAKT